MTLRELSALVSAVSILVGTVWYIYFALRGDKVKPVLASWIIIAGTITLSFATYWTSPKHSLVSNVANAASVLAALSILITVFLLSLRGRKAIIFSIFQKWCLVISGLIAVFWVTLVWGFNGTGFVPNILTQFLMFVGYLVTAEKLYRSTKNTESIVTWSCIVFGNAIALYTGIVSSDTDILAIIYAGRATVLSVTIVGLMCRIEGKNRIARANKSKCEAV